MEAEPRIIGLLTNKLRADGYSLELDNYKQVEIVKKILQSELLNESEVFSELRRKQEEKDARSEINAVWGHSLDLLDLQVELSIEACSIALEYTTRTKTLDAINRIYGRGCHIGSEICHLLKGGYPDGAEARWRTLYELDVISKFIGDTGDDVAERYLSYEAVEMKKFYSSFKEYYDGLRRDLTPKEKKNYEITVISLGNASSDFDRSCKRFGPNFKNEYGWAADILSKKKPNFADIEEHVGYRNSRILKKMANFPIHGGPRAAFYRRGLPNANFVLTGPSIYGFKDVINFTTQSMVYLTEVLMLQCNDDAIWTIYDIQFSLTDEIVKAAEDAETTLGPFESNNPSS